MFYNNINIYSQVIICLYLIVAYTSATTANYTLFERISADMGKIFGFCTETHDSSTFHAGYLPLCDYVSNSTSNSNVLVHTHFV